MAGDGVAQFADAERQGVAQDVIRHRRSRGVDDAPGSAGAGLADLEMEDLAAGLGARLGGAHHLHHLERRDRATAGRRERIHSNWTKDARPNPRGSTLTPQPAGLS